MTNSTPNPIVDEKIYVVPVTALTPFPGNPRRGNVDVLAESLRTNGQYRPVVVRRETREILAGNHTVQAAQKLGWENVKVQFVDGLTDAQAKRIVLADNRTTDLASYSMPDLTALLEDLSSNDSLTGTGFTEFDFTSILRTINPFNGLDNEEPYQPPNTPTVGVTPTTGENPAAGNQEPAGGVTDASNPDPEYVNVAIRVGVYRFIISYDDFHRWEENIYATCGYVETDIVNEIKRRLGF